MRWRIAFLGGTLATSPALAWAQKPIVDTTPVVEDFTTFNGDGFSPNPSAGQLDSDDFAGLGMSDGNVPFGGTAIVGDWARGPSPGGEGTAGVYAFNGLDRWLFVQPTDADFSPGTLTVRYVNQTAKVIPTLEVAYQIQVRNDQGRASTWTFSYSADDVTYVAVPALNYTTPTTADTVASWVPVDRATTLTGLSIPPGGLFYIRFTSNDAGGAGSRDEIGIDKISVTYPALIFEDGFESGDFSRWSLSQIDGGDLTVEPEAALGGTTLGMQAVVDDTNPVFVEDLGPAGETRYIARFYFDPNGFDPGETLSHFRTRLFILFADAGTRRVSALVLKRQGGNYSLMQRCRRDDNSQADTGFFPISDDPHWILVEWQRATGDATNDGQCALTIDGDRVATLPNVQNHLATIGRVRLGALSTKGGANGTLFFDEFVSKREGTIPPLP
jgi:hypothetical protein